MAEPALDLSEIIGLYKEDARRMAGQLQAAWRRWEEVQAGGPARQELRKFSHQLRGSGRTYGFREVTCLCKAMENIVQKMEKNNLPADDRVREALRRKIERLVVVFSE
jgi:chemotaxis protein histidine kinase CheA